MRISIPVYGTALEGASPLKKWKLPDLPCWSVMKAKGYRRNYWRKRLKTSIFPSTEKVNRLNVGIAAGILMYYLRK